jgi:hypothetical protein
MGGVGPVILTNATALPAIVMNRGAMPLVHASASLAPLIDMDDDRQSRPQLAQFGAIIVEHNAHGHTLHDLCEIARCVLRRDDAELGASCRRKARDATMKGDAWHGISDDLCRLLKKKRANSASISIVTPLLRSSR